MQLCMRCIYAVCLDGSPPGYHFQRGFGSGTHSWIVYLQVTDWPIHFSFFSCKLLRLHERKIR
jgi:hypothetical protein